MNRASVLIALNALVTCLVQGMKCTGRAILEACKAVGLEVEAKVNSYLHVI